MVALILNLILEVDYVLSLPALYDKNIFSSYREKEQVKKMAEKNYRWEKFSFIMFSVYKHARGKDK